MHNLILQIDSIISNINNQINDKIIGINYLDKLKYLFIDEIKNLKIENIEDTINIDTEDLSKDFGENQLSYNVKFYKESITSIKKTSLHNYLSLIIEGQKSINFLKNEKNKKSTSINLFAKTGVIISKDTFFTEKISKGSLILDIKNNLKTSITGIEN